ncbi:hypothetical protein N7530_011003 [Penicillium desertorum]|jgi:5'-3' exonuclease|uniref:Uncharacterized protein n=1 Tax=Penicillium desertorum TaxID=1303715 RepID=A0A9W9WGL7_9EURO|nr:hypothetical protein N7530_011003 [Penicillium desertorum]
MAPGCTDAGTICNLEAFMREISKTKKDVQRDANKKIIKTPDGKPIIIQIPEFDKVDWALIGEGADLSVFSAEIDKSGFSGKVDNMKMFKGWDQKDNFESVMTLAEDIGKKAIAKLKANKNANADDRINKTLAALKAHADARRYDVAQKIVEKFETEMKAKGISVVYTDPIERPPVPGYRKIDTDKTISENMDKVGFSKMEKVVRDFVKKYNSAGTSLSHVEAIAQTQGMHDHLAEACKRN